MGAHPVQRTANAHRPMVAGIGIKHRHLHVAMTQQLLDGSHVRVAFEYVCGEGMAILHHSTK